MASKCRGQRSAAHNGPGGELVKRRIREPIIYSHTIHVRRAARGRSDGVTPSSAPAPTRIVHELSLIELIFLLDGLIGAALLYLLIH